MASRFADIVVTKRCNFKCKHCDCGQQNRGASGLAQNWFVDKELTSKQWMSIFERWSIERVWLRGIEPLLYPQFSRLLKLIGLKSNLRLMGVTTNGWLINRYFSDLAKHCDCIAVSLDGLASTHDEVRGVKGAFTRALDGVVRLKKAGKKVLVSFAVTPVNVQDMIPLYQHLAPLSIPIIFNHYNFIHARACRGLDCSPTNMGVYNPRDVELDTVLDAIKRCKGAQWSPLLTTRRELREYYCRVPTVNKVQSLLCNVLKAQKAGERIVVAANGDFILSHRCWIKCDLGNALTGSSPPKDQVGFQEVIKRLRRKGFPPPCQRLCCAGKMV